MTSNELDREQRHDLRELGWRVYRSQDPRRLRRREVPIVGQGSEADIVIPEDNEEIVIELPEADA